MSSDTLNQDKEIQRLARLMRIVEGAWAIALYKQSTVREQVIRSLRKQLSHIPLVEQPLDNSEFDILALLQEISSSYPSAIVCFYKLEPSLELGLGAYLDLRREALRREGHRLIFWLTPSELEMLSTTAPNFVSRINTIFRFLGNSDYTADKIDLPNDDQVYITPEVPQESRAQLAEESGRLLDALEQYQTALIRYRARAATLDEARVLTSIGKIQNILGEPRLSVAAYQQAQAIYRALGKREQESTILNVLGDLYLALGDIPSAQASYAAASGAIKSNVSNSAYQLRAPIPDFVGREDEVTHLTTLLKRASSSSAVVGIISGVGGIGKTELAMRIGWEIQEQYPDGQIFINLAGSLEPPLSVAQAIQTLIDAYAPDVPVPLDSASQLALYHSILNKKRVLILADDARNGDQVKPLLPPLGCALLITSRARLDLPNAVSITLDELPNNDASTLLQTMVPKLRRSEAMRLAALCHSLPLALRITGGLLANNTSQPVSHYLERLNHERSQLVKVDLLLNFEIGIEPSIRLSYSVLTAEMQQTLTQLSVFSGSCNLNAISSVLEATDHEEVVEVLSRLNRLCLVEYEPAEARYSLHDLVRNFALARLTKERDVRLRHAQYFIQLANHIYEESTSSRVQKFEQFAREQTNIDAALTWLSANKGDFIADSLFVVGTISIVEVNSLLTRADRTKRLEAALVVAQRLENEMWRQALLNRLAYEYAQTGNVDLVSELGSQALAIAQSRGDIVAESESLGILGQARLQIGDYANALKYLERRLSLSRELGDMLGEVSALSDLANIFNLQGDLKLATSYLTQALNGARELNNPDLTTRLLLNLGQVTSQTGRYEDAISLYGEAFTLSRTTGDVRIEAEIGVALAITYYRTGRLQESAHLLEQALEFLRMLGDEHRAEVVLSNLGTVYQSLGKVQEARRYYEQALDIAQRMNDRFTQSELFFQLGAVYRAEENNAAAISLFEQANVLARESENRRLEARALNSLASIADEQGYSGQAIEFYIQSINVFREIGDRAGEANTYLQLGMSFAKQKLIKQAVQALEVARRYMEATGNTEASSLVQLIEYLRENGELPS